MTTRKLNMHNKDTTHGQQIKDKRSKRVLRTKSIAISMSTFMSKKGTEGLTKIHHRRK